MAETKGGPSGKRRSTAKQPPGKERRAAATSRNRRRGKAEAAADIPKDIPSDGSDDVSTTIIDAAFSLWEARGWRDVSLTDIAAETGLSLEQVRAAFPCKTAIVGGLLRRIDEEMAAGGTDAADTINADDSARDRLFDVLMRRFDALAAYKGGLAAILGDGRAQPLIGLIVLPRFLCAMAGMLDAAGLSTKGIPGVLRVEGLALIYANAFRVWLRDDSSDMAKTMAALDKGLRQAEMVAGLCRWTSSTERGAATA